MRLAQRLRAFAFAALVFCGGVLAVPAVQAQDEGHITVTLTEERSIRDIAKQYLGDSDLWPEILRANGLTSIIDLRPGQSLQVPVSLITAADSALRRALVKIQEANKAGAQLFAPVQIEQAIDYRDDALVRRGEGVWEETLSLAEQSEVSAVEARDVSETNRDQAAEARLSDRQGDVEGQQPRDLTWGERPLNSILIEEEKVRTLSRSTAQITFRDASRLRLNANSQAVIQRMRVDPLNNREEARVSLVEGDFYALLAGDGNRQQFQVDIPEIDARIDSGNFWVSHGEDGARFTNYDDKPVEVQAHGETVMLGRNEGTVVRPGETPDDSTSVLPQPALVSPDDDGVYFSGAIKLTWNDVPRAQGYWLEVAHDPGFGRMVHSRWGLFDTGFEDETFPPGQYYWRIAALDSAGLPGARSAIWRFDVRVDTDPPYLRIQSPVEGDVLRDATIDVTGESEADAAVTINGVPAELDTQGAYAYALTPEVGDNAVVIVSRDPAGNETSKTLNFVYMPDRELSALFDDDIPATGRDHFLTGNNVLSLAGETAENAQLVVLTETGDLRTTAYADGAGRFTLNVPMEAESESFALQIIAPSGLTSEQALSATIDKTPPNVGLSAPVPRVVAEGLLVLEGSLEDGATLTLNGNAVTVNEGAYAVEVELRPGANLLEFVATDAVGNVKIEKWVSRVDNAPPELVRHVITPNERGDNTMLTVQVFAEDDSGLVKVAPFSIVAGGQTYTGYMRYNRAMRGYQGSVEVPAVSAGDAALARVELQDHAGNSQVFEF